MRVHKISLDRATSPEYPNRISKSTLRPRPGALSGVARESDS